MDRFSKRLGTLSRSAPHLPRLAERKHGSEGPWATLSTAVLRSSPSTHEDCLLRSPIKFLQELAEPVESAATDRRSRFYAILRA
jgi:hypothetical protein